MSKPKGIFCLEGDWWNSLREPSSVEPILDILDQDETRGLQHVHRDIATPQELEFWLKKWAQNGARAYKILYLAFHGEPGKLFLSDLRKPESIITLDWIAERLKGKCKGRIIFFGGCSVMKTDKRLLKRFLRDTGALAVCGYCADVDWLTAVAFELLTFSAMQDNSFMVRGARAIKKHVHEDTGNLAGKLDFRMVINE